MDANVRRRAEEAADKIHLGSIREHKVRVIADAVAQAVKERDEVWTQVSIREHDMLRAKDEEIERLRAALQALDTLKYQSDRPDHLSARAAAIVCEALHAGE